MHDFTRQKIAKDRIPFAVAAKWGGDVLEEGFIPFPKKLLRTMRPLLGNSPELAELSALLALVDYYRPNLTRNPSIEFLAFAAGISSKEMSDALMRLQAKHLLTLDITDENSVKFDLIPLQRRISELAT